MNTKHPPTNSPPPPAATDGLLLHQLQQQDHQLFMMAMEAADVACRILEASGTNVRAANHAAARMFKLPEEHLLDSPTAWLNVIDSADRDRIERALERPGEESFELEYRITHAHGQTRWLRERIAPMRDANGQVIGRAAIAEDITHRKSVEASIQASEYRCRLAIEAAQGMVYEWFPQTDRVVRSSGLSTLLGFHPAEVDSNGAWWQSRIHPDDRSRVELAVYSALTSSQLRYGLEYRVRRRDLEWRDVQDVGLIVRDLENRPVRVVGLITDITTRKQTESMLRQTEATLRSFYDNTAALMGIVEIVNDRDVLHIDDNATASRFFHLKASQLVKRGVPEAGQRSSQQALWITHYRKSLSTRSPVSFECEHDSPTGKHWLAVTVSYIGTPPFGRPRFCYVAEDITSRKQAELELNLYREQLEKLVVERSAALNQSNQRLRVAERMAALGTLSAGLGHDMGNLLLPIRLRLDSMMQVDGLPAKFIDDLAAIRQSAQYLQQLTNGLRLLALDPEDSRATSETTDLLNWWNDAHMLLRNALPRTVALECRFADDLPRLSVSPHALMQIVFNLVQNAGEALKARNEGSVVIRAEATDDRCAVRLRVSDDGPGMSDEVRQRCMEPFFTTKAQGTSTGLGLALVQHLVQKTGGRIEVESTPGNGATFTITYPVAPAHNSPLEQDRPAHHATISLNDKTLSAYAAAVLQALGFTVHLGPQPDHAATSLWVIDGEGATPQSMTEFIKADSHRLIVALGRVRCDHPLPPRIVELASSPTRAALWRTLRQAAMECQCQYQASTRSSAADDLQPDGMPTDPDVSMC